MKNEQVQKVPASGGVTVREAQRRLAALKEDTPDGQEQSTTGDCGGLSQGSRETTGGGRDGGLPPLAPLPPRPVYHRSAII